MLHLYFVLKYSLFFFLKIHFIYVYVYECMCKQAPTEDRGRYFIPQSWNYSGCKPGVGTGNQTTALCNGSLEL